MDVSTNITLCVPRPPSGQSPDVAIVISTPKLTYIPANHILLRVDRFGFSANNVTYQALGEHPHYRYFDFHTTPEHEEVSAKSHGIVPVWGFATVITSGHPKIAVGERVYGYLAPTRYLLLPVSPSDVNKYAFYISRPHLPADYRPYNQVLRCATDPQYTPNPRAEDLTMLYRPLFWTAYWFEDWLWSSKISGVAHITPKIIGLTSSRNMEFTKGLELYDEVLEYSSFTASDSFHGREKDRWVYVDVAGNAPLNQRVFDHFTSPYTGVLAAFITLGMTNLSPSDVCVLAPGGAFLHAKWLAVRRHELRVEEIFTMQEIAWKELMRDCGGWVEIERAAYEKIIKDGVRPSKGLVWSLWDSDMPVPNATRL
ncbi:uncharacterized protein EV420DRAFT_1620517 [Desarmillaria tabescens]|uniref:Uncharacterized protein n=1 Tax=Armillaria tabescens TaxID=1929756 RepID=A0AA39N5M8_ARMTA|nr:uncharacterized protein EV420DRAFT_1620517 [Desarmillaria tabescens]KAK0458807.1 hypothetical protein EV420DRAFT_1620517 [Desarmillaria tabescens]